MAPMDFNDENLSGRIRDWLEKQGQSLEMRVAKSFQENGFVVSQFEYFLDKDSRTIRQTDVVASISRNIGNSLITINLVIECKYAKAKPWVILITQQKFDKFSFFGRVLNGKPPSQWKRLLTLQGRLVGKILLALERSTEIEFFDVNPAGYALLEARLDSNYKPDPNQLDYAYEAIMQVSKCTQYHDDKCEDVFKNIVKSFEDGFGVETGYRRLGTPSSFNLDLNITIPLVVINGRLFKSCLSADDSIEVSELENGFVLMPHLESNDIPKSVPLSAITIVTESNLESFILKLKSMLKVILEQENAISELLEYEESMVNPLSNSDF
jgi:hypothetical protein